MIDLIVNTKNARITLDYNNGQFRLEQVFNQVVNLPIILLNLDNQTGYYIRSGTQNGNDISFHADDINGTINHSDTEITFKVESQHTLGIMIPCPDHFRIHPLGFLLPCPDIYTSSYHYLDNLSNNTDSIEVAHPSFEFHKHNQIYTVSTNDIPTCFNVFDYEGHNYMNVIIKRNSNSFIMNFGQQKICHTVDVKEELSIKNIDVVCNQGGCRVLHHVCKVFTPTDMRKIFYYGVCTEQISLDPKRYDSLKSAARYVQNILKKASIDSVVMGSLAMYLRGIETDVGDVDIAVLSEDMERAFYAVMPSGECAGSKLERITLNVQGISVEIYAYDAQSLTTIGGEKVDDINIVRKSILVGCRLWLQTSFELIYENTYHLERDNLRRLIEILHNPDYFYQDYVLHPHYMSEMQKWSERCICLAKITEKFRDCQKTDIFVSCPYPCMAQCFKVGDSLLISVVNMGSSRRTTISLPVCVKNAKWVSVENENPEHLEVRSGSDYSEIDVRIIDMGIITAQWTQNSG